MQARAAPPTRRGGFLASEPLLLAALIILTVYFARDLLAPMAFALVLNFLLAPAVALLERWRLSRAVSVVRGSLKIIGRIIVTTSRPSWTACTPRSAAQRARPSTRWRR